MIDTAHCARKIKWLAVSTIAFGLTCAASSQVARSVSRQTATPVTQSTLDSQVNQIFSQHCTACHFKNGPAPFAFASSKDTRKRSRLIAEVTASHYMPPWLPEQGDVAYEHERGLSPQQISEIAQWSRLPIRFQNANLTLTVPSSNTAIPGAVSLNIKEPFPVPADGIPVTRSFIIPVLADRAIILHDVQILPDHAKLTSHAALYIDTNGFARHLQNQSGGIGYTARHSGLPMSAQCIAEWSPNSAVLKLPSGYGWQVPKGADLVLEVSYEPHGEAAIDRPAVTFAWDADADISPLSATLGITEFSLRPDQTAEIRDEIKLVAPVAVLRISPHLHPICQSAILTAVLPTGKSLTLLKIDHWNSEWEEAYVPTSRVGLPKGTLIQLSIQADNTYKNPRLPKSPLMEVIPGLDWMQPMGTVTIDMTANSDADRSALRDQFRTPSSNLHVINSVSKQHG